MSKTQPVSLKDFFAQMGRAFTTPPIPSGSVGPGFSARTNNLPNGGGSYQSPTPSQGGAPYGSPEYVSPSVPVYSRFGESGSSDLASPVSTPATPNTTVRSGSGRVFSGGSSTPAGAPTTPTALNYSKYINPETGKPYSPQEYADKIAGRAGAGSIPRYAGDAITNPDMSAADLQGALGY